MHLTQRALVSWSPIDLDATLAARARAGSRRVLLGGGE